MLLLDPVASSHVIYFYHGLFETKETPVVSALTYVTLSISPLAITYSLYQNCELSNYVYVYLPSYKSQSPPSLSFNVSSLVVNYPYQVVSIYPFYFNVSAHDKKPLVTEVSLQLTSPTGSVETAEVFNSELRNSTLTVGQGTYAINLTFALSPQWNKFQYVRLNFSALVVVSPYGAPYGVRYYYYWNFYVDVYINLLQLASPSTISVRGPVPSLQTIPDFS
ncbi:hypothetical protein [Sulfodiicoccus acidiphilus]|nr:hypothetical protein [Sulfodiicoccus acidiphilus]